MKSTVLVLLFAGAAAVLAAEPAVLVNTAPVRPLLSLSTAQGVLSADLPPGARRSFDADRLSGLGEKNLALEAGQVYYIARFAALPRWYRLGGSQVLAVNKTGRALRVTLPDGTTGLLAAGTPVLAESTLETPLELVWTEASGAETRGTAGPGLFQWLTEDGAVVLRPWSEDSATE